jgi:hypothetical protein
MLEVDGDDINGKLWIQKYGATEHTAFGSVACWRAMFPGHFDDIVLRQFIPILF